MRWEADEPGGVEPVPEWLDDDLGWIAVGKELGMSAMAAKELNATEPHWITSCLVKLEAGRTNADRRGKS